MKYSDTLEAPFELAAVNPDGTLRDTAPGRPRKARRLHVSMPDRGADDDCTRLPDRLLLYADEFTRADKTGLVRNDVISITWMSAVPAFFIAAIAYKLFRLDDATAVLVGLAVVMGALLSCLWRAYFKHWNFYEKTVWLDFTDRHWYSRKHYVAGRKPDVRERLAFGELALVLFYRNWEQGGAYEIAISDLSACKSGPSGMNSPPFFNLIYSSEDRVAAFDCLSALSACWGIDSYSWDDGAGPLLKKIDPQPSPSQ